MRSFFALTLILYSCTTTPESPQSMHPKAEHPTSSYQGTILVLGDWGASGSPGQRAVSGGMRQFARKHDVQSIISVGDNFYPDGLRSLDDPHWEQSFYGVYGPLTAIPWHITLGNHDWHQNPWPQLAHSQVNPLWVLPAPYWARTESVGKVQLHMVHLDTNAFLGERYAKYRSATEQETLALVKADPNEASSLAERFAQTELLPRKPDGKVCKEARYLYQHPFQPEAQLRWLREELASSQADWRIVVGHHPIFPAKENEARLLEASLSPVLEQAGVDIYLAGHIHLLQHEVHKGCTHLTSGAGSAVDKGRAQIKAGRTTLEQLGFGYIHVYREELRIGFAGEAGESLFETSLAPKSSAP